MSRKCTCIRCRAEALVRDIYPNIDDAKALLAAEEILKITRAIHASPATDDGGRGNG